MDTVAEIKAIYQRTTRATITRDLERAIALLKTLPHRGGARTGRGLHGRPVADAVGVEGGGAENQARVAGSWSAVSGTGADPLSLPLPLPAVSCQLPARIMAACLSPCTASLGQLVVVGFEGKTLPEEVRALAREFDLGGVILFKRNVESPEQVAGVAVEAQQLARELPLWVGVDQEGGRVARLRRPLTEWPAMAALGRAGDEALAGRFAGALARGTARRRHFD